MSLLSIVGFLQDVSRAKYASMLAEVVVTPSTPAQKDDADRKPEYPKPDTNQMIPFQPRHLTRMYPFNSRLPDGSYRLFTTLEL